MALKYSFGTPIQVRLNKLNICSFQTIQLVILTLLPDPSLQSAKMSNIKSWMVVFMTTEYCLVNTRLIVCCGKFGGDCSYILGIIPFILHFVKMSWSHDLSTLQGFCDVDIHDVLRLESSVFSLRKLK